MDSTSCGDEGGASKASGTSGTENDALRESSSSDEEKFKQLFQQYVSEVREYAAAVPAFFLDRSAKSCISRHYSYKHTRARVRIRTYRVLTLLGLRPKRFNHLEKNAGD